MEALRTAAGERWRHMQDAARGQAARLADPDWVAEPDPYAGRVDSFRAGARTDHNVVDLVATANGPEASVLEVGAGAGRLCLPLARLVREVIALEPNAVMADALEADAAASDIRTITVVRSRWQDYAGPIAQGVFAAHLVYALPNIEEFLTRIQRFADRWCGMILFAQPSQSQLAEFWPAVFGEARLPNPCLPELLEVLWSFGIYPDVTMLEVPIWPLGPPTRALNGLRRRLRIAHGSAADQRLQAAMRELLIDWGGGVLGPRQQRSVQLAVVSWSPR